MRAGNSSLGVSPHTHMVTSRVRIRPAPLVTSAQALRLDSNPGPDCSQLLHVTCFLDRESGWSHILVLPLHSDATNHLGTLREELTYRRGEQNINQTHLKHNLKLEQIRLRYDRHGDQHFHPAHIKIRQNLGSRGLTLFPVGNM